MQKSRRGFTLIELLVVTGILSAVSTGIIFIINPAELMRQTRDAIRISDAHAMERAIGLVRADGQVTNFGAPATIYTSLPDSSATCANLGLPSTPAGFSWNCAPVSSFRKVDGTGWVPVNFVLFSGGSPFSKLPVDPENTTSSGKYYIYIPSANGTEWTMSVPLVSTKYASSVGAGDNGYNSSRLEVGTNLSLASSVLPIVTGGTGGTAQFAGPRSPQTAVNDPAIQGEDWDDINDIKTNDNQSARAHGELTEYAKGTNFGFTIPGSATINGIVVEIKKKANDNSAQHYNTDNSVKLIKANGTFGSADRADTITHWPTNDTLYTVYGSPTDLWGDAWTPTDINSANFGAAISAQGVGNSGNDVRYWINHIRVTVYYTN